MCVFAHGNMCQGKVERAQISICCSDFGQVALWNFLGCSGLICEMGTRLLPKAASLHAQAAFGNVSSHTSGTPAPAPPCSLFETPSVPPPSANDRWFDSVEHTRMDRSSSLAHEPAEMPVKRQVPHSRMGLIFLKDSETWRVPRPRSLQFKQAPLPQPECSGPHTGLRWGAVLARFQSCIEHRAGRFG